MSSYRERIRFARERLGVSSAADEIELKILRERIAELEEPYIAWHEAKSGAEVDAAIDAIVQMGAAIAEEVDE